MKDTKLLAKTAAITALTCLVGMTAHFLTGALVPFSLLPLMVFLAGIILGPIYGALSMIIYLLLGLFGLPVFASPPFGGIGYIFKPTFGFLIGYIPAAYLTGKLYGKGGLTRAFLSAVIGLFVLYAVGLSYLYGALWVMGNKTSVIGVLSLGFTPFIVPDLLKAGIAAALGNKLIKGSGQT